jgi:alpha-tubulin suppressor-like RCC1 family protein
VCSNRFVVLRHYYLAAVLVALAGSSTFANTLAAGSWHTAVIVPDGTVYTWGANSNGQLGDASSGRKVPQQVAGLTSATDVAAGSNHTLVLRQDGTGSKWSATRQPVLQAIGDYAWNRY